MRRSSLFVSGLLARVHRPSPLETHLENLCPFSLLVICYLLDHPQLRFSTDHLIAFPQLGYPILSFLPFCFPSFLPSAVDWEVRTTSIAIFDIDSSLTQRKYPFCGKNYFDMIERCFLIFILLTYHLNDTQAHSKYVSHLSSECRLQESVPNELTHHQFQLTEVRIIQ